MRTYKITVNLKTNLPIAVVRKKLKDYLFGEFQQFPDGDNWRTERLHTIKTGYDHYWRYHDDYNDWADIGCPICKSLLRQCSRKIKSKTIRKKPKDYLL